MPRLLSAILIACCLVAIARPVSAQKLKIGPDAGPPPGATKTVDPDAAEKDALKAAGLAPGDAPASRPATGPSDPRLLYPDVSFKRTASKRPDPQPQRIPPHILADDEVEASIRLATELMIAQVRPDNGRLRGRGGIAGEYQALECGLQSLAVYALLQAGKAIDEPRLQINAPLTKAMLDGLKRMNADGGLHQTYARSLRAMALSVFNREEDRAQLTQDVNCLTQGHVEGGYGYLSAVPQSTGYQFAGTAPTGIANWIDHSNTQYGLLGVWCGAEASVEISPAYWQSAVDHWSKTQSVNGGWAYRSAIRLERAGQSLRPPPGLTTLSMNAAGTASLFVAGEYAEQESAGGFKVGREPFSESLRLALKWWENANAVNLKSINATKDGQKHWGYTLYGIERVGLASGFKFFGEYDWFRHLGRHVIDQQRPDGSWGDLVDTSYALLFLSRGRHPLLMNKLRFDGKDEIQSDYWANRPHDISYLSRYASKQVEREMNWQVVPLKRDHTDWLDAPILYIASHKKPRFTDADIDKLRKYVEAGGMIFTNADADDFSGDPLAKLAAGGAGPNEFDKYIVTLAGKLFPQYAFEELSATHPIYSSLYKVIPGDKGLPKLKGVSNGSRLLLVHSSKDLALGWQRRDMKKGLPAYQLGMNLFVYANGKSGFRHRLESWDVPELSKPPLGKVPVARLQYKGNWNPEPGAWDRFGRLLAWKTGTGIDLKTIETAKLKPADAKVVHLTGTAAWKPTAAEVAAIKAYVEAGGVLLIDDTGGAGAFAASAETTVVGALTSPQRSPAGETHPLMTGEEPGTAAIGKMHLRNWTSEKGPGPRGSAIHVIRAGKGTVILSYIDLTTGLLGIQTWGINGYDPTSCEQLVRNVILRSLDE
ncbi:DUF4159 domain-containing protein [Humisphaera borealis]|uniref:DUF4159 domain-containing protein n=1 Tax=Humisphaera borealis TaxID=2807512 RepID=A0A7M2WVH1_9BACT|nr:DUF4159 domain-containing protein [Humisphaera borealis]QOV89423.1 DUF4159 domain-containing protein [Humisphaera borealis]